MASQGTTDIRRRSLFLAAGALAAAPLATAAFGQSDAAAAPAKVRPGDMPHRKLGTLDVSAIGIGVQNMTRTYQTTIPDRAEMINIIRAAHENGITLFDAAEAYGPWVVEELLGEAVESFRDEIVIETKFGWNLDQETGARLPGTNSKPDHIKVVVDNMLKRLRTDRIDMLYQHRVDAEVPIEDVAGAVKDLIAEGKVLHWGMCEMGPETLRRAHAEQPLSAVQNEYSMLWRGPQDWVLAACEELGIGLVPWSPLGVGFMNGAIDENTRFAEGDIRGVEGRFSPDNLPSNLRLVALAREWAERKEATPGQIGLAWLLAQKPWIVPIPGSTQMAHMLDNIGAASVQFSDAEVTELNAAVNAIEVQGSRLPDGVLAFSELEAPPKA